MHTFLKWGEGDYRVGMWLPNVDGIVTFNHLFRVASLERAIKSVNTLNGGDVWLHTDNIEELS